MRRLQLVAIAACATISVSSATAQQQDVKVTVSGAKFQPGAAAPVNVALKVKQLPRGYSNPVAYYYACTAKDETANWNTGLGAEVFCALQDQQTRIFTSKPESVDDIASGASATHTFAETLTLPTKPVGTKVWVIVRLDYEYPGLAPGYHASLYGSANLFYRCNRGSLPAQPGEPDRGVTRRVTCAYYTPGGLAIWRGGASIPKPPPQR